MSDVPMPIFEAEPDTGADDAYRASEALALIDGFLAEVRNAGGVSRPMIEPMIEAVPNLLPAHVPVASYTRDLSTTNLEVTQESLLGAIGRGIADAAKAVWAFLVKIFDIIVKFFKGLLDRLRPAKRHSQQIAEIQRTLDANQEIGLRAIELTPSQQRRVESLRNDQAKLAAAWDAGYNALTHAVLHNSKPVDEIRAHLLVLPSLMGRLESMIGDLQAAADGKDATIPSFLPGSPERMQQDRNMIVASGITGLFGQTAELRLLDALAIQRAEKRNLGSLVLSNQAIIAEAAVRVRRALNNAPKFGIAMNENDQRELRNALAFLQSYATSISDVAKAAERVEREQAMMLDAFNKWSAKEYEIDMVYTQASTGELNKKAVEHHRDLQKRLQRA